VLSAAQMLRYSFNMEVEANVIEKAIEEVLDAGYRTVDISEGKSQVLSTKAMIRKVILTIEEDAPIAGIMSAYA
jgi:3-isopropylmalate dehydrogenase